MEKIQVLMIHGGEVFDTDEDYLNYLKTKKLSFGKKSGWYSDYLEKELGDDFQITWPRMPLSDNSKYRDWKILFEKYLDLLGDNVILIGRSLGGIFLAKYLSENVSPKKILSVYLTAPVFSQNLPGGFGLGDNLSLIKKNCNNVTLMFSKDDNVVDISSSEKYREKLKNANIVIYESKNGHFKISEFPEIVEMMRKDLNQYENARICLRTSRTLGHEN